MFAKWIEMTTGFYPTILKCPELDLDICGMAQVWLFTVCPRWEAAGTPPLMMIANM